MHQELLSAEYIIIFQIKDEIYDKITQRYYVDYYKIDIDKLREIRGNAKEKIHDAMVEIFKQRETGIKLESIDDEIDYRSILLVLSGDGFAYENSVELGQSIIKDLTEFFTEIVEEGQKNREIRQDFSAEDIAESLIVMHGGIQYKWEVYLLDDMIQSFEDNFNFEWEKIRFRE